MLNQLVLVGRIVKKPELREAENNKKYSFITLAVPRSFKNVNGGKRWYQKTGFRSSSRKGNFSVLKQ